MPSYTHRLIRDIVGQALIYLFLFILIGPFLFLEPRPSMDGQETTYVWASRDQLLFSFGMFFTTWLATIGLIFRIRRKFGTFDAPGERILDDRLAIVFFTTLLLYIVLVYNAIGELIWERFEDPAVDGIWPRHLIASFMRTSPVLIAFAVPTFVATWIFLRNGPQKNLGQSTINASWKYVARQSQLFLNFYCPTLAFLFLNETWKTWMSSSPVVTILSTLEHFGLPLIVFAFAVLAYADQLARSRNDDNNSVAETKMNLTQRIPLASILIFLTITAPSKIISRWNDAFDFSSAFESALNVAFYGSLVLMSLMLTYFAAHHRRR